MPMKSICFYNDREAHAVCNDGIQLVSITHEFKFEAPDGKQLASEMIDQ